MSITLSFVLQLLIRSLMVSSCDSVNSRRVVAKLVIYLNTCGSDDDDLQAEQTAKGNHRSSTKWLNESIFTCLCNLSIPFMN